MKLLLSWKNNTSSRKYLVLGFIALLMVALLSVHHVRTTATSLHTIRQQDHSSNARLVTTNANAPNQLNTVTKQAASQNKTSNSPATTAPNSSNHQNQNTNVKGTNSGSGVAQISGTTALKFSVSKITISSSGASCVRFIVNASDNSKILPPTASYYNGVLFQFPAPTSNADRLRTSWEVAACRANPNDTGNVNAVLTSKDDSGNKYSGTIPISLLPAPYFIVTQGALTTVDNGDSITYTAHFSFTTHGDFGNPLIRMTALDSDLGCASQTAARVFTYTGQNNYTMSCTMSKYELNANTGSGFFLRLNVQADYVAGGGGISYTVSIPAGGL